MTRFLTTGKLCCQDSSTEEHWRVGHRLVRLAHAPIKRIQRGLCFAQIEFEQCFGRDDGEWEGAHWRSS